MEIKEIQSLKTSFTNQLFTELKNRYNLYHLRVSSFNNVEKKILEKVSFLCEFRDESLEVLIEESAIKSASKQLKDLNHDQASETLDAFLDKQKIYWRCNQYLLDDNKGIVYGVLNTSPESFYDGNLVPKNTEEVLKKVSQYRDNGVDVIELGGQTTRPNYIENGLELTPQQEIQRVIPYIKAIKERYPDQIIAVDTYKYEVMQAAIEAGVDIINDVNGFVDDQRKIDLLKNSQVGALTMFNAREYDLENVENSMLAFFKDNLEKLGIDKERIALDPGIGYAKNSDYLQDLTMMNTISSLKVFRRPIMTAVANKGWAKQLLNIEKAQRKDASLIAATEMYMRGAKVLRVHDIKSADELRKIDIAIKEAYN